MQLLARMVFFSAVAVAAPRALDDTPFIDSPHDPNLPSPGYVPPPLIAPVGKGGDENGRYYGTCTCTLDGDVSDFLGDCACQVLHQRYDNLAWDGVGCIDKNNRGVEALGMADVCLEVGHELGYDLQSVWVACTPF